jgi:acyl carrier protein
MHNTLNTAILEYLANEFKLDPKTVGPDLNFITDLKLDPSSLPDFFQRLQDALDFTLPEDRPISTLATVEDLLQAIDDPDES